MRARLHVGTVHDLSTQGSGTLLFDLTCQLLHSNYDGRLLYTGEGSGASSQVSSDIASDIKRLCVRLKKLAESLVTDGATFDENRASSIAATSRDLRYRLEGSLLVDEVTKQVCLLVKVEKEGSKVPGKLNSSDYQSLYGLTRREIQVLELLCKGAIYKEISYSLKISFHTVRDHVKHIRFKLNADGKCGILARLIEDDPRGAAAEKSRLPVVVPAPITSGTQGESTLTPSAGTSTAIRTTASGRPTIKRDVHPKGKRYDC
jgi:DNA-binding CsgD family transcriptional regulator